MGRAAALRIALLALGAALLVTTLVLCFLPGPLESCGSLLAPMFPVRTASSCPASQNSHLLAAIVTGAVGLAALVAGVIVRPPHRHHHSHHDPHRHHHAHHDPHHRPHDHPPR